MWAGYHFGGVNFVTGRVSTLLHAMTTHLYFFNMFYLSKEMKDKCTAIIQKKIILKITIWRQESYKTSMQIWKDYHGMVLASPSESQTCGLELDFKASHNLS